MKQLLFLLLFPCLAMAQYTGNAGQKITLGEQTTADGLVFRGLAADTTRKPIVDTMAYILLDTNTNIIWQYKKATNNAWTRVGGSISSGVTGVLPVANGGTGNTSLDAADIVTKSGTQTIGGAKTFTSAVTATRFNPTANTATGTGMFAPTSTSLGFSISGTNKLTLNSSGNLGLGISPSAWGAAFKVFQMGATSLYEESAVATKLGNNVYFSDANRYYANSGASSYTQQFGTHLFQVAADGTANNPITFTNAMQITQAGNVGIGTASPAVQLHTTGGVRFATFAGGGTTTLDVDNTGNLARTSSIELKKDVTPINYGLNQILQINPINFNWINEDKYGNENENGFIAEDVMNVIPNVVGSDAHGLFMDYTKLIPILTKAIQEQNLLIKALEQRINNLENK